MSSYLNVGQRTQNDIPTPHGSGPSVPATSVGVQRQRAPSTGLLPASHPPSSTATPVNTSDQRHRTAVPVDSRRELNGSRPIENTGQSGPQHSSRKNKATKEHEKYLKKSLAYFQTKELRDETVPLEDWEHIVANAKALFGSDSNSRSIDLAIYLSI